MGNNLPVLADTRRRAVSDTDLLRHKKAVAKPSAGVAVQRCSSGAICRKPSVRRSIRRKPSVKLSLPVQRNSPVRRNSSVRRNGAAVTRTGSIHRNASVRRTPSLNRNGSIRVNASFNGNGSFRRSTSVKRYNKRIGSRSVKRKKHPAVRQRKRSLQRAMRAEAMRVASEQRQLIAAAASGKVDEVEILVDTGVDVNSTDENLMTPLHHAAKHSRDGVIRALVERGADVNATDLHGGFTPLHWVVINANPQLSSTNHVDESIVALSRGGCNLNSTDFNSATPLHLAAQTDNLVCINSLIRLGANPDLKNIMGRDAKQVARGKSTERLIHKLQKIKQRALYHVLEVTPPPTYDTPGHFYHILEVSPNSPPVEPIYTIPEVRPPLPPRPPTISQEHYYHTPEIAVTADNDDEHVYHVLEVSPPTTPPPPPPRRRKHHFSPSPPPVTRPPTPPRRRKCHSSTT